MQSFLKPSSWHLTVFIGLNICANISLRAESQQSSYEIDVSNPDNAYYDYSYAGYREGRELPSRFDKHKKVNVQDYGAIPNDGKDDTEAFLKALGVAAPSVVTVPEGVYDFSNIIVMNQAQQVLRGEGVGKTILKFHKGLEEIDPRPIKNLGGTSTSKYSWSGGFIQIKGNELKQHTTHLTETSERLSEWIEVEDTQGYSVGDRIVVRQYTASDGELISHLYAGDPDDISRFKEDQPIDFPARVSEIQGRKIKLDRPCRKKLKPAWGAELFKPEYTVTEVGVQDLSIEFPKHTYAGHFKEAGYNALETAQVANCWVKNVEIINCDSGLFIRGTQCTVENVVLSSPGTEVDAKGFSGHHGITLSGTNHLLHDFAFHDVFIHDITIGAGASGHVVMKGKGKNLSLDHHKRAPHANLFTELDLGEGSRFLASGGGPKIGRNSGAWSTFWNVKSQSAVEIPLQFGPAELIFVGLKVKNLTELKEHGTRVQEQKPKISNLYLYQLEKRLNN